jgi:hypothetical protein
MLQNASKTWKVQLSEFHFKGIDVFNDGRVQIWEEFNPRDTHDDRCTAELFLNGKFNDYVEQALGKEKLEEIREYVRQI